MNTDTNTTHTYLSSLQLLCLVDHGIVLGQEDGVTDEVRVHELISWPHPLLSQGLVLRGRL